MMLAAPGVALPDITLPSTAGKPVNMARLAGTAVIFCYPWTGRPGHPNPPDWDTIPGAHGSTPQAQGYSERADDFAALGVTVYGLSFQDTAWQQELRQRLALRIHFLSDAGMSFAEALRLPTFQTGGRRYLQRLTLFATDGIIAALRFPVPDPAADAAEVLQLLSR